MGYTTQSSGMVLSLQHLLHKAVASLSCGVSPAFVHAGTISSRHRFPNRDGHEARRQDKETVQWLAAGGGREGKIGLLHGLGSQSRVMGQLVSGGW